MRDRAANRKYRFGMRTKTSEDYYNHLAWLYGGTGLGS